jgi:predicted acetyltransferase
MQLALALPIAHAMDLQKVLITCADDLKERSEKHDKF